MEILKSALEALRSGVPLVVAVAVVAFALFAMNKFFEKRYANRPQENFKRQLTMLIANFIGLLIVILASPLSDTYKGQLLSLIGVLLSAAIALSSTTFVGNAMAGIMLRVVRSFRMGDFVRVGDSFGRVSERGLFHVELQTEDRDLTTLPNLYLVTNPVKVIRSSGTIVAGEVSLGYEVPRERVEKLLVEAGTTAGLVEPFVHITKLGDFSVNYRLAGLLVEVKKIMSARSLLHKAMLDKLHKGGIEIVSPNFMNTRAISEGTVFRPPKDALVVEQPASPDEPSPEALVFDKAEEAESTEQLQQRHDALTSELTEAKEQLKSGADEASKEKLKSDVARLEARLKQLGEVVRTKSENLHKDA